MKFQDTSSHRSSHISHQQEQLNSCKLSASCSRPVVSPGPEGTGKMEEISSSHKQDHSQACPESAVNMGEMLSSYDRDHSPGQTCQAGTVNMDKVLRSHEQDCSTGQGWQEGIVNVEEIRQENVVKRGGYFNVREGLNKNMNKIGKTSRLSSKAPMSD